MKKKVYFIILFYFIINNLVFGKEQIKLVNNIILSKIKYKDLENWENEDFSEALDVFLDTCNRIKEFQNTKNLFPQSGKNVTKKDFFSICKIASVIKNYDKIYKKIFFEYYFIPYKIISKKKSNSLFTGYYIPIIKGKLTPDNIFKYPIYKRPLDLNNNKYYTRKQINNGYLNNKHLEILYTDNPIELFFVHIQGSANVYLVDQNKTVSILFDGKNNHKYFSIGQFMVKNNLIDKNKSNSVDLKYELKKNINLSLKLLNLNESYVFFKLSNQEQNIKGAFGSNLQSFRTVAVDQDYIPLGFPLWLNTIQTMKNNHLIKFNKLVVANDTGSAINGIHRGDIFFGYGEDAEEMASHQYSEGEYYLLIPEKIVKKL